MIQEYTQAIDCIVPAKISSKIISGFLPETASNLSIGSHTHCKKPKMRGRPKDGFTWSYFDDDENGTYWVCQVKTPISLDHPEGTCNKNMQT
nr:12798_t:CDS:2 [Entrophospora candida]CAG8517173.1 10563_t:CDS:2 [Entrophospora candida]